MTVTRFAPSPTGYLHLGHAYAAWFARKRGERMLFRMEDIDAGRVRVEYYGAILEDMDWLGIEWDGEVVRQSERMDHYSDALSKLKSLGVTYPCFCTRKEILEEAYRSGEAPQGPDGPIYPGTCRRLTESDRKERINTGQPFVVRIDCEESASLVGDLTWSEQGSGQIPVDTFAYGDFVVARKDVATSYHLSVVVDDHLQGVSLVTRGMDLKSAAQPQRVLQALLGIEAPEYLHHGLVLDDDGKRLAKRDGALSLRVMRERGMSAEDVRELADKFLQPPVA